MLVTTGAIIPPPPPPPPPPEGAAAEVQAETLNSQEELQLNAPTEKPRLAQVAPPKLAPSHCSPEAITPSPQTVIFIVAVISAAKTSDPKSAAEIIIRIDAPIKITWKFLLTIEHYYFFTPMLNEKNFLKKKTARINSATPRPTYDHGEYALKNEEILYATAWKIFAGTTVKNSFVATAIPTDVP